MVDANLMHWKVTGKSATGILHLINQTLVDWFLWKQSTVETATYGSEFVAARIATEQVIELCYTLRSMGVPIEKYTWLLGDNKSVIMSSTIPHLSLRKCHQALAYHQVRSAVAAGFLKFCHIDGKQNPADIMTKFLPYPVFWSFVQPLLLLKVKPKSNWHNSRGESSNHVIWVPITWSWLSREYWVPNNGYCIWSTTCWSKGFWIPHCRDQVPYW